MTGDLVSQHQVVSLAPLVAHSVDVGVTYARVGNLNGNVVGVAGM
jgi:hypothetical protein